MTPRESADRIDEDPLWYKDAIVYELHVRSFHDSENDGVGDFRGLTQKLGYLQDLGVTALWLLPFYPSPLKDDGYDIADYTDVHPAYGTLGDFRVFLREAHARGLRVITELVLNHTSDRHPWFQRARRAKPGSVWRDYYVWSDTPDKYRDARIIFKDFEASNWTWDPVARAYYWHRFYSHQPDLNYNNPRVRKEMTSVVDFWLGLGVDGLRLDAVPYLYEREGTSCENLPETHAFLRELRAHVDAKFPHRMLLGEANQWPEDAAQYFGRGDECHMAYHFPLMPRLFMAVQQEDRFPILDILSQTPVIPETAQWALFLRNHDELTLEMVTDEERDYMYRMYARDKGMRLNLGIRRRLAPLLENDRRKIELMLRLLLSLPGTPILYYGDEIGMGDNVHQGDRNGVRTPMQWSPDRNAGFSRANPQQLYLPVIIDPEYHYEVLNVDTQLSNPSSLLWWVKRLLARRKEYRAFGRGTLEFLHPANRKVLAFVRRWEDEALLIVANLSRHTEYAELDLSAFKGVRPVEIGGGAPFPAIGDLPYLLTLGRHTCYWFSLERPRDAAAASAAQATLPTRSVRGDWRSLVRDRDGEALEPLLPDFLRAQRWFRGKAREIDSVSVRDAVTVFPDPAEPVLAMVQVEYTEGEPETYVLPLAFLSGDAADRRLRERPQTVLARLQVDDQAGVLADAFWEPSFLRGLLETIVRHRRLRGRAGEVAASTTRALRGLVGDDPTVLEPAPLKAEQTNTSAVFGDRLILKLYRKPEPGPNPELELGWYLSEQAYYPHVPAVAGALYYGQPDHEPSTLALLEEYIRGGEDAWQYSLDALGRYFERVATLPPTAPLPPPPKKPLLVLAREEPPANVVAAIGPLLEQAALLGQRTGELHLALARPRDDPDLAPEPFTPFYQRSLYHGLVSSLEQNFARLRERVPQLPEGAQADARRVLALQEEVRKQLHPLQERTVRALRIRCHGDYHLGQVLHTGKDFVIIDFEGEPARPLSARRIKTSALRDVAGMIRSFHYAASVGLRDQLARSTEAEPKLEPAATLWYTSVAAAFLRGYLSAVSGSDLLPETPEDRALLLDAYLYEKAMYEVGYELNHRPEWVSIPLKGFLQLLESRG